MVDCNKVRGDRRCIYWDASTACDVEFVSGVSVKTANSLVETVERDGVFAGVEESGGDESNEHCFFGAVG